MGSNPISGSMACSFLDEPEEVRYKKIKIEPPEGTKAVSEVPWPESVGEKVYRTWIMVDEESSPEEIRAEIDYIEDQLHLFGELPMSIKKGLWECLAHFEELLESH